MDWPPLPAEEGCSECQALPECQALKMGPGPVNGSRLGKQQQALHLTTRAQLGFTLHYSDRVAACARVLLALPALHTQ